MSQNLSSLSTQPFDLNGDIQLQRELQNIKIAQDDYNLLNTNSNINENKLEEAKATLRFAQLRYAVLHELKAQNLQLDNSSNKIFWPTEDAICECCLGELIDLDGTNPNWKVRTCGHVGCNDSACPSNSNVDGAGRQHTALGQSIACPMCRRVGRGIFQGGNTIKRAKYSPLGRTMTCALSQINNYATGYGHDYVDRFTPQQVLVRVNIMPEDINQQIEEDNEGTEINDIVIQNPFKAYLALIKDTEHANTSVLATELVDHNQDSLSQGYIEVIDISGSMECEIENIKKTLIVHIYSMSPSDYYSLIVFDDKAYTIIAYEKATTDNKTKWISLIKKMNVCGGTSYTAAINELIIILNEINQISPSLFSRTRVLIMGDGAGDMDQTILPQLHDLNINLYGITIGNQVNVETIKTVIGQICFDQGNYRHYDNQNSNLFELISSMELLATTFIKDVKIIVKNATIDTSNIKENPDGTSELIYKYHGPGVKRLRIMGMTSETEIIISYGENILCDLELIQGDQVILGQFCSYRKVGIEILECTTVEEIDSIIASITQEKFGEHTDIIIKLANTKKQQIEPALYPNITTPIQYSQNYTQNTIASLSATRSATHGRQRSGI
jgi:hypothetical protein